MLTPAYANAYRDAALTMRRASARCWTAFRPHRDSTSCFAISAAVHLLILFGIGAAIYESGEDDQDIPELSVQLVTRDGPNSQEFTEAALPQPAPEPPIEQAITDPGNGERTIDAPALADTTPMQEMVPDVEQLEEPISFVEPTPTSGAVLTTTGDSANQVPLVTEPVPEGAAEAVPQTEQVMLTRNVQKVAMKLLDTNATASTVSWQEDGQQYSARILRQPAPDSTGLEQVIAEIMTSKDGKRLKTRLSLKRLAFSHFTQLVNHWDPNIQMHDDVIDGRFHSNTEFGMTTIGGVKPKFFGKVTTSAATLTIGNFNYRRNKDVFQGGAETRTDRVMLPRDMPDVVGGGDEGVRRVFADDTRIIFNPDGSYVWRLASGEGELHRGEASPKPQYLIGEKSAKLYVRGTVAGIFTVYSPNDIEIEDDIVYKKDPRQTLVSQDYLALISGRDIRIAAGNVTGPGDLTVHAALFARRRFFTEEVDHAKKATMFIYGSLTAGTILETEPRYATKLDYDKRFEYLRPASFPMTRRYEVDSWDQDWKEVEGSESDAAAGNLAQAKP